MPSWPSRRPTPRATTGPSEHPSVPRGRPSHLCWPPLAHVGMEGGEERAPCWQRMAAHMRVSPGPTRRTLVVSIEALLDARGGKNLRGQGQAHRSPSENARELAVYMYSSLQAVSFREAVFVLRPLPKGPVAKAVIVYFMACCKSGVHKALLMRAPTGTAVSSQVSRLNRTLPARRFLGAPRLERARARPHMVGGCTRAPRLHTGSS